MRWMQLLRDAAKHAGSGPVCRVDGQISALPVISSSSQQCFAVLQTQSSTCTDPEYPKILITGWFLYIDIFNKSFLGCFLFLSLLKV